MKPRYIAPPPPLSRLSGSPLAMHGAGHEAESESQLFPAFANISGNFGTIYNPAGGPKDNIAYSGYSENVQTVVKVQKQRWGMLHSGLDP